MSFTVNDFHDLVEILYAEPLWRAEIRRLVLSDELLKLPADVQELKAISQRNEQRLEHVEGDIVVLKQDVSILKQDVSILKQDMSDVKGDSLERRVREKPFGYLSRFARRVRLISNEQLGDLLEDAVDEGKLTEDELEYIKLADAVAHGLHRESREPLYLVVEVSGVINAHDLTRAVRRAALLQKATGVDCMPVIAGRTIAEDMRQAAAKESAGWLVLPAAK